MTKKRSIDKDAPQKDPQKTDTIIGEMNECTSSPLTESAEKEVNPLQPASLELLYGDKASSPPEELTKEKVESSVRKKLARKTDEEKEDPFVPQAQLDSEVIQVAREKGFPLSRGTEIGARLLARAKRTT
jgi:hypothetical protein